MMPVSMELISRFLSRNRIAMVGVSRNPKDFSVLLFNEFVRRGYDMVPVNPVANEICGKHCYRRIQDVEPSLEAALLMTPANMSLHIAYDCWAAGVRIVWMYRASGKGAVSMDAVRFCEARGIEVIPGECPFMFLPQAGAIHRFHGLWRKITGRYPALA